MGSALLNTTTDAESAGAVLVSAAVSVPTLRRIAKDGSPELRATHPDSDSDSDSADALRMQVAERLAAHRRRRMGAGASTAATNAAEPVHASSTRSARIAATVAERYAHTQSYRAFLAAEAERAIEQAQAAAEVAARNAQAIADTQQKMLDAFDEAAKQQVAAHELALESEVQVLPEDGLGDAPAATLQQGGGVELNLWPDPVREEARRERPDPVHRTATTESHSVGAGRSVARTAAAPALRATGFTVRLYEDAASAGHEYRGMTHRAASPAHTNRREYRNEDEAMALDEEIAFRQAPVFDEPVGPPVPLPANLIEFPRQLVASRKARPRLAEGPLREEAEAAPGDGQLRIFEVEAAQISTQPVEVGVETAQWSSIWLDTPREAVELDDEAIFARGIDQAGEELAEPIGRGVPTVQAASIARRVTAGAIDVGLAVAGVTAFAATALAVFSRLTSWHIGVEGESTFQTLRLVSASIASQTGMQPNQFAILGGVVGVFLVVVYHAMFFWFSEATPGMRCVRIGLCTFDDENPTRRAVRRRLGAMMLSVCALGMGFLWALLDEEGLTWHDRITRMYLRSY